MTWSESPRLSIAAIFALSGVCILAIAGGVAAQMWTARARAMDAAEQSAVHLANVASEQVARTLETAELLLRHIGADHRTGLDWLPDDVAGVVVLDGDGRRVWRNGAAPDADLAHILAAHRTSPAPALRLSLLPAPSGNHTLAVSRRLESPAGAFAGVVVAVLTPGLFDTVLTGGERAILGVLYLPDGTRLAPSGERGGMDAPAALDPQVLDSAGPEDATISITGMIGYPRRVSPDGPAVVSFLFEQEALRAWRADARMLILLAATFCLSLATGALHLARMVERGSRLHRSRVGEMQAHNLALEHTVAERTSALQEKESRLRAIFEHAGIGIAVLGPDGAVLDANRRFLDIAGLEAHPRPASFPRLIHPDDRDSCRSAMDALASGEQGYVVEEMRFIDADGEVRYLTETAFTAFRTSAVPDPFIIAMPLDVTHHKRMEAEVNCARDEAERANHTKSRFLAAASHDLRQPLQALMMFVDELNHHPVAQADPGIVRKIEASAESLANLLNGLLDIGAIDSGVTVARVGCVPIGPILERTTMRFSAVAEAKGLVFSVVSSTATVRSDPVLLGRILSNLVSNAVGYTETGRVLVGCRRRGESLVLEVFDTGCGIAADQLPLVFDEFYQVGNRARDRRHGTGLGLAIVDRLARMLGHEVEVRSRPGRGSRFALILPLVPASQAQHCNESQPSIVDGEGAIVVVIDDDPEIRQSLARALRIRHYTVLAAASGREATEMVRWAGRMPAAVIADYRLSDNEVGTEAIQALRACFPGSRIPAILLTGDLRLDSRDHADILILRKPITPATLCAMIQRSRSG